VSTYRLPLESVAGAFAPLVGMVPWKILVASGWEEDPAALASFGLLLVLALTGLFLRRTRIAERRWVLGGLPFVLRRFFSEFALFMFAHLALWGGIWLYASHAGLLER
jgi:hypothetical protein